MTTARKLLNEMRAALDEAKSEHAIATLDYVDRKLRRRKAIAAMGEAATHAGLDWDRSTKTLVMYVSRFTKDQPDKVGDVVSPDAFTPWLRRWKANPLGEFPTTRGKMPIVVAHAWNDFSQVIGWAGPDDCAVDTKGLLVAAHLFDTPEAKRTWETARDLGMGASFSFEVAKDGEHTVRRNGKTFNELTEFARVMECGPCLFGAEPTAGTVEVKAADRAIFDFDDVVRKAEAKGYADTTLDALPRCRCGASSSAVRPPVKSGTVPWQACSECGSIRALIPADMSAKSATWETRNVTRHATTVPVTDHRAADAARAKRLLAHLKKGVATARQKRDVAALVKFSRTPARPSRADQVRDIDELQRFVKKAAKSTTTDIGALFGRAPAFRDDQLR